jgi:thiol-disulfide isomerase/thioredoxin
VIAETVQTTWMMRDFEFISRHSLADRLAAWIAAAMVVLTTPQFAIGQEPPKNFVMHDAPKPVAAIKFDDAQGQSRNLADFKGKVVLLNIWATWCVPCRKEMPALDRLQAALGGPDFEVVALSIDRGGMDAERKFFADIGIGNLAMYLDSSGQALRQLGAVGLPMTLLIERDGREIGRLIGSAEWDSPKMVEFVRCVVARSDAARSGNDPAPAVTPLCAGRGANFPASGARSNSQP